MPATGSEAGVTESRGSALASLAGLLLAFGAALLLHEWRLLPAPQNLLPLLLVVVGLRGALHTERGARVVSILVLLAGVVSQAAILQDLPASELGLLRPLGAVLSAFDAAWGVFMRFAALGLVVGGAVLLAHARRRGRTTAGPPPAGSGDVGRHVGPAAGAREQPARDVPGAMPMAGATPAATGSGAGAGAEAGAVAGDAVDHLALFSGVSRSVTSPAFRGGRLVAIFGGLELDLTRAAMTRPEARLDVWALFGGASIRVPAGCEVVVQAVPIFGGVDVRGQRRPPAIASGEPPPGGRLVVGGLALFGGIDVES
jgi:hypothetical protein